jgi:hypothetical protein
MTQITDEAGIEFILPVAKWRCFQGKANIYGRSFGTLTHGVALGALTRRIALFSTLHLPLVTPACGGQGDRHHRPCHPQPRRTQQRLRLEPGGLRPARRHDRPLPGRDVQPQGDRVCALRRAPEFTADGTEDHREAVAMCSTGSAILSDLRVNTCFLASSPSPPGFRFQPISRMVAAFCTA